MQTPLDITFRGMEPSPALEAAIRTWVERLEYDQVRIQRCSVTVEQPHHHHARGNPFCYHIVLSAAGHDIAVSHKQGNEDAYVALGDAFRAARRQLREVFAVRRHRLRTA